MLIPAFYGYSREIQDTKYLYVLYPIFCVLACFTFKMIIIYIIYAIIAVILTIGEFNGLYIAYNSSMTEGIIASILPPYAIYLGLIGFF